MSDDWCKGCGRQITDAEIPWCYHCAPECGDETGTPYEELVP